MLLLVTNPTGIPYRRNRHDSLKHDGGVLV
jgi:hypothetical protein